MIRFTRRQAITAGALSFGGRLLFGQQSAVAQLEGEPPAEAPLAPPGNPTLIMFHVEAGW